MRTEALSSVSLSYKTFHPLVQLSRLYPPDSNAPSGKARLLYEVAPMSYLAEQAGGIACVGPLADQRVLEVVPQKVHQKSPLFVGSATEMRKLQAFLAAHNAAKA